MRAISSMMPIFSATSLIAVTVRTTASPLARASSAALEAILSVCLALSAFCCTLDVISSIAEVLSSAEAACSVAPCESCCTVELISSLPVATLAAAVDTSDTVLRRFPSIFFSAWPSASLSDRGAASTVKSPSAMAAAICAAVRRFCTMLMSDCPSVSFSDSAFGSQLRLPSEISPATLAAPRRLSTMRFMAAIIWPNSSFESASASQLRSPLDTRSIKFPAMLNGRVMLRTIVKAMTDPSSKAIASPISIPNRVAFTVLSIAWPFSSAEDFR